MDLSRSRQIAIVDREKRNEVLEEQEFSTFQLLNVETGEAEFKDKVNGSLGSYDALCAEIARRVLADLKADVPSAVAARVEGKTEKPKEAAVAFADAVDVVDRNDESTAREKLQAAQRRDPKNEAVAIYIDKLAGASPRFRIELETSALSSNPAYNGLIEEDSFYSTLALNLASMGTSDLAIDVGGGFSAIEAFASNAHVGYRTPSTTRAPPAR